MQSLHTTWNLPDRLAQGCRCSSEAEDIAKAATLNIDHVRRSWHLVSEEQRAPFRTEHILCRRSTIPFFSTVFSGLLDSLHSAHIYTKHDHISNLVNFGSLQCAMKVCLMLNLYFYDRMSETDDYCARIAFRIETFQIQMLQRKLKWQSLNGWNRIGLSFSSSEHFAGFMWRFIQNDVLALPEEAVELIFHGNDLAEALNSVKSLRDKRLAECYK